MCVYKQHLRKKTYYISVYVCVLCAKKAVHVAKSLGFAHYLVVRFAHICIEGD